MYLLFACPPSAENSAMLGSVEFQKKAIRSLHAKVDAKSEIAGLFLYTSEATPYAEAHYYLDVDLAPVNNWDDVILFVGTGQAEDVCRCLANGEAEKPEIKESASVVANTVMQYKTLLASQEPEPMGWTTLVHNGSECKFVLFFFKDAADKYRDIQRKYGKTVTVDHDHPIIEDFGSQPSLLGRLKKELDKFL